MVTALHAPPFLEVLTFPELAERAARVRLVLTDCDGTLTDGTVYYSEAGEAMKRFSLRDGLGVERLREAGIATAIVTREVSLLVRRRAEKLHLPFFFDGIGDKAAHLPAIERETGLAGEALAYIGDDLNDLGILEAVARSGLTACPADAVPEVRQAVHYCASAAGGLGAFREFAEWILRLRAHLGGRG
jgi:3-deoxy-D-manno-octulosonate 8-phosphate phosphatase (KDO 8-P phosphatase)